MKKKISILIEHSQTLVCSILSDIISRDKAFELQGSYTSVDDMLPALNKSNEIDIILISDLSAQMSILEAVEKIKQKKNDAKVLLYMTCGEKKMFMSVLARTNICCGFIHPATTADGLTEAIKKAAQGEIVVDGYMDNDPSCVNKRRTELSEKEKEVFYYIVMGCRLVDIAQKMGIDAKTVSTYKNRICHKLGVKTTFDLLTKFYLVV